MAVIKKIKIPGETLPRDIGVNSSNVVYDGDSGTTTTLNSKIQSIFTAIGDINSFEIALVNALPTENIDDHTIYFVPNSQDANTRDEYMYVGNQWEMIGSTTIDLSDYPTYDDISIVQGLTTGIPAATITVGATTTTIYSEDGSKWNNVELSKSMSVTSSTCYIPYLSSVDATSARLTKTSSSPVVYCIPVYDGQKYLHSATPTAGDKSNKVATTSFVADAITTTVTPVAALTTGITIGSIDVSGTTTVFYAPEVPQKYEVILDYDENNDKFSFHNSGDTFASIIEKIQNGYDVELYINDAETVAHLDAYNEDPTEGYLIFSCWGTESDYIKHSFSISSEDDIDHWSTDYYTDSYTPPVSDPLFVNYYGQCSDTSSSSSRNVTVDSSFRLVTGVRVTVRFDSKVSTSTVYLDVNGTGSKTICYLARGTTAIEYKKVSTDFSWTNDEIIDLIYDGDKWVWVNCSGSATRTSFGPVKVGNNIDITQGVISVTSSNVTTALGYIPVNKAGDTMGGTLTITDGTYTTTLSNTGITTPGIKAVASYFNRQDIIDKLRFICNDYHDGSGATYCVNIESFGSASKGNLNLKYIANQGVTVDYIGDVQITGITTPTYSSTNYANYVASKGYVDSQISSVTSTIPSITATAGLTTGVTIGAIDINGVTTTLYAPEDTKVTQTDVSGVTENIRYPILVSSQSHEIGTTTTSSIKSDYFEFSPGKNYLIISNSGSNNNGGLLINDYTSRYNLISAQVATAGTSTTIGKALVNIGNRYTTEDGPGNSMGSLAIFGKQNTVNVILPLDETLHEGFTQYENYLPIVDDVVLAAGVTTGVGSSTVPVYMNSNGELLACTLPTSASYSLSMTGATITLLADGVAASTITLPIYDGTIQ